MNKTSPFIMLIRLVVAFFLLFGALITAFSQVKIGDNPTVVAPSAILEIESTDKGLLKPRLTTAQRTAIASPASGLEVYDTDTQSTWYYNGTAWVNVGSGVNLYNADGTLAGNRTVTQGANTLSFTSTATNGFSVDGTTFSVDAANNRVGVGTNAPQRALHVLGDAIRLDRPGVTGVGTGTGTPSIFLVGLAPDGTTINKTYNLSIDQHNGDGFSIMDNGTTPSGPGTSRLFISSTGNVGIGTSTPNANAVVDATAVDKGVLLPRVALSATNNASPLSAFVAGMTVYNTATAGTSSTAVTPGLYYSDGTKWIPTGKDYVEDPTLGSIAVFPYNALPSGYLECNGAAVSRSTYSALFAKIGTTYGAGNGSTTFNLPDLRGEFIRGWDNGRGADAGRTLGSSQVDATSLPNTAFTISTVGDHTHSVDPPSTGSSTDGAHTHSVDPPNTSTTTNGNHTHTITFNNDDFNGSGGGNNGLEDDGGGANTKTTNGAGDHSHTVDIASFTSGSAGSHSHSTDIGAFNSSASGTHNHTLSGGDAETRPRNVSMVYAIKAVESVLVPSSTSSAVSAAAAANEPWFKVGTTTGATSNTDNVYLMGNVGIGTSSPGGQLSNTAGSINHLNSLGGGLNYNASLYWRAPSTSGSGNVAQFVNEVTTGGAAGVAIKTYANDASTPALDVSRGTGVTSGTPLFNVLTTGNVGIGTNTPTSVLEIVNNNTGDNSKDDFVISTFGTTSPGISLSRSGGTQSSPSNLTNGTSLGEYSFGGRWAGVLNNFGGSKIVSVYRGNGTTGLTDLQFWTSNTQRMTVDENGNVGIGTSSPQAALHVLSGGLLVSAPSALSTANQGAHLQWNRDLNGHTHILNQKGLGSGGIRFGSVSTTNVETEWARFIDNGNLGLGTTTPNAPLQFANTTVNRKIVLFEGANNDHQYYGFGINGATLRYQVDATGANHVFYAATSATTSNELMRITGTGRVGIGTTNPATRLCNTNINYVNSQVYGYSDGTLHWVSSEGGNIASFINTGTGPGLMVKMNNNSNMAALDVSRGSATTAGTSLFMVAGNGYVGVGTNAPNTKLDLSGAKPGWSAGTGASSNGPAYAIIPGGSGGTTVYNDFPNTWSGGLSTYDVVGASCYFSGYVTRSDSTLKKDIQTMGNPIVENFMKIRPVTYLMKEQTPEMAGLQYGFIAQEIGELFPSLVTTKSDPKGTIGMNYQGLIAPTVYMVQQQQQEIEAQKNTIEKQQEQLEEQTAKLNNLQKQMDVMMGQLQALQNGAKETSAPTVSLSR